MNGRKPTKFEQIWIDKILEYGCCACRKQFGFPSPASVHHINGGDNHFETLPLCYLHHQGGANTDQYTSRHPWKKAFERRYGTEEKLLAELRETLHFKKPVL